MNGPSSPSIAALVEEDILPRGTPVGEVLVQIVGPLTLGTLFDPERIDAAFADRLVERLLRGYVGEVTGGGMEDASGS